MYSRRDFLRWAKRFGTGLAVVSAVGAPAMMNVACSHMPLNRSQPNISIVQTMPYVGREDAEKIILEKPGKGLV